MATTVYRCRLRPGWIVQGDDTRPFRIDLTHLATVQGQCQDRLVRIAPVPVVWKGDRNDREEANHCRARGAGSIMETLVPLLLAAVITATKQLHTI
jgi:hypothetical protein